MPFRVGDTISCPSEFARTRETFKIRDLSATIGGVQCWSLESSKGAIRDRYVPPQERGRYELIQSASDREAERWENEGGAKPPEPEPSAPEPPLCCADCGAQFEAVEVAPGAWKALEKNLSAYSPLFLGADASRCFYCTKIRNLEHQLSAIADAHYKMHSSVFARLTAHSVYMASLRLLFPRRKRKSLPSRP